ncbi:hypothetical protein CHUAL_003227 [Chamberlinius hualienensis]
MAFPGRRKMTDQYFHHISSLKVMTLLTVLCLQCSTADQILTQRFTVPHDAYPGFAITRLNSNSPADVVYRLLDNRLTEWFALVDNGLLITTGNISHMVNAEVPIEIYKEYSDQVTPQLLKINVHVLDNTKKLNFPFKLYIGHVSEHSAIGTVVQGLEHLSAVSETSSKGMPGKQQLINYQIISGNTDELFHLEKTASDNGVRLVVNSKILDREVCSSYVMILRSTTSDGLDAADTQIKVVIDNINDHAPIFDRQDYFVRILMDTPKFTPIAQVRAYDADGDRVIYKMTKKSSTFFVVPKTGEVFLIGELQPKTYDFEVSAHDDGHPMTYSTKSAQVHVEVSNNVKNDDDEHLATETVPDFNNADNELSPEVELQTHSVDKRHVKRSVRPTKTVEYRETDGKKEDEVVFILENESGREKFQLREDNPWVKVDSSGAVRVRKKWDYEELGPEKSIDFWVTITNTRHGGKHLIE